MIPADPRIVFQVTGAVLGALALWVLFVLARMPTRVQMPVAKPDEKKPAAKDEKKAAKDEKPVEKVEAEEAEDEHEHEHEHEHEGD